MYLEYACVFFYWKIPIYVIKTEIFFLIMQRPRTPVRRDGEPLSLAIGGAAMTFEPPIISAIFHLAERIHTIVKNHGSNQRDCLILDDHVNELVSYTQYLAYSPNMIDQLQQPLMNLEYCLERCCQFLEKYTSLLSIEQVVRSGHYKRKFDELNNELNQYKKSSNICPMNMTHSANRLLVQSPRMPIKHH